MQEDSIIAELPLSNTVDVPHMLDQPTNLTGSC